MTLSIAILTLNRCDRHVCFHCLSTEHVPADLSDSIGCCSETCMVTEMHVRTTISEYNRIPPANVPIPWFMMCCFFKKERPCAKYSFLTVIELFTVMHM